MVWLAIVVVMPLEFLSHGATVTGYRSLTYVSGYDDIHHWLWRLYSFVRHGSHFRALR